MKRIPCDVSPHTELSEANKHALYQDADGPKVRANAHVTWGNYDAIRKYQSMTEDERKASGMSNPLCEANLCKDCVDKLWEMGKGPVQMLLMHFVIGPPQENGNEERANSSGMEQGRVVHELPSPT